jgi:integrase
MVAGHLREKNGYYHMVLNYVDEYGKRHTPSKSTGLTVKGNKKRAEKMLSEARAAKEAELEARAIERSTGKAPIGTILFTAFLLGWLEMTKKNVEETTYGAYSMGIKSKIIPYFEEHHPGLALQDVTPKHIQDYYTYELTVRGVSANTVIHRHANIRKALQHAFKLGLIDSNPADRIERPKKEKFVGSFYEEDELNHLFEVVRGDPIELGVILGAFYGLRRSEAVGLKWDAIDFKKKTITIRHTVTQATIDGKSKIIQKDRTKTKASYRSLPLVPPFEELLHRLKAEQELNRKLCGKSYCRKFADYIYVNEIGELVKPGYITQHFPLILQKNGMRKIRFHDLRHPYVKHTTKIFSLRLMDFQAQAYPDARRKTRGACQLLRVGQSRSPVRPLCNRKRFSCLPPQSKMSWILYAISMRLSGYTSTRSISSSASSVVSVSASKIALDAFLRLSRRACSSCFCFACANTAA